MRAPVIALTVDAEEPGGYSKFPWYALRQNYAAAVGAAGGTPVLLPHESESVAAYLRLADALIVTGGHFDVDPALFGASDRHATVKLKEERTRFELAVTKAFLDADKPVLGICGGEQLLNVVLGGTLIQHIPDEVANALKHEQPNPRNQPGHKIKVAKGTRLHAIVGEAELAVNSAHHQAVKDVARGVDVNARAEDGVIEGIEDPKRRFCIGVQWHPEFTLSEGDARLFAALIDAARR
jgi:putative glutamine amidotransferase